jgi:hypothetical protein
VIDRIELARVDHVFDIRDLDSGEPAGLEHVPNPGDEVVEIGNVCQHVVGVKNVSLVSLARQLLRKCGAEEFDPGVDAVGFDRTCRDIFRWLDAEHRNAGPR